MVEDTGRARMRAADADREQVADRLRIALQEGRLDLHEYDERLQRAYAAKTYGDLAALLADLPVVVPTPPAGTAERGLRRPTAQWVGQVWSPWVPPALITTAIWAVTSVASGHPGYFWPIWVTGPWGAVLGFVTLFGLANGAPRRMVEERERKELARQRRLERGGVDGGQPGHGGVPSPRDGSDGLSGLRRPDTPDPG